MKKIAIVGAGIIGRLLAFGLIRKGYQVTIFDANNLLGKSSCSYAAAGMLSPIAELESGDPFIYELGKTSLELWDSILLELNAPVYFKKNGSLMISHAQDVAELNHFKTKVNFQSDNEINLKFLSPKEMSELEPDLHWKSQGLYLQNEGQIDNRMLLSSLTSALLASEIDWQENSQVKDIIPGQLTANNRKYHFDLICDCRGLGAKKILSKLRGVRGELIYLHAPQVNITRPIRFFHPRYRLYIVPRLMNNYLVGASEIESEDLSTISVRTALELLSAAYSIHHGFAEARVIESITNCRPAFPDNLPGIFYQDGLIKINGLYRHGYLISPILVNETISIIENGIQALHFKRLLREV